MKELYFTSANRRSLRTVRLEYGKVKKVFVLRELAQEKSMVRESLKVLQVKKYLRMNKRC